MKKLRNWEKDTEDGILHFCSLFRFTLSLDMETVFKKAQKSGVPIMAQQLTNLTGYRDGTKSPSLALLGGWGFDVVWAAV